MDVKVRAVNKMMPLVLLLAFILVSAKSARAEVPVHDQDGKNFSLGGDLRYRYEIDNDNSKSGDNSAERTRERVRLRFGGKYEADTGVKAGFQIATGASNIHSPHQTLGRESDGSLANADFGTDKAYVEYKKEAFRFWAGKNSLPVKTITWVDGDYNPEGLTLGYELSGVNLSLARYVVQFNGNAAVNDNAIFFSASTRRTFGGVKLDASLATLSATESPRDAGDSINSLPGGTAGYNMLTFKAGYGIFTLGGEYMMSGVKEDERGGADAAESSDTSGIVVYVGGKINDTFGAKAYYYDIGYASVPFLGYWAADDFPKTSNYTGTKFQLDIEAAPGMKIDVILYSQETKNRSLTSVASDSDALKAKSAGEAIKITRTQVNLNVAF